MSAALRNVAKWSEITRQSGPPNYEEMLRSAYSRFLSPGDIVFDVGAHAGDHTRFFLDLVGPSGNVVCFEPLPGFADLLRRSCPSASVRQVALANHVGTSQFVFVEN